ncbi:MAG: glycoside hydrolase family 3 N-terminal domain-containing protein [Cyclonatronaceae bacterium]
MSSTSETHPYQNAALDAAERTRDLLSRMTLEEKAAQMMGVWNEKADTLVDEKGHFDAEKAKKAYKDGNGLGQVGRPNDAGGGLSARELAELTNAIQRFFVENTRLGIPVVFHEECLHGLMAAESTSFSQPIGLAGTFNPELVEKLYEMTAAEARSRGAHQALTPVVDVARDPRWGRVEETFGEDPYLVSRMGIAAVKGFQGQRDFTQKDRLRVMATLKHFAAHGQPESGMNCAPVNVSERVLRETFLYPFKAAIHEAGAISVMASYNEIDGVPSHASVWLLRNILRKEWGFRGFVVSDYYAIWEMNNRPDTHGHFIAEDKKEAARLAVRAGVNVELPEPDCYKNITGLVAEGKLQEETLDELVEPLLRWKFEMGLFDAPYCDPDEAEALAGAAEHKALALQAGRETITLLKNEGDLLPLEPEKLSGKTVAVIGPNANCGLLGGYSGTPVKGHEVTILEGIKTALEGTAEVVYHEGCRITEGGSWFEDEVVRPDPEANRRRIAEAKAVAEKADVVILAVGGNAQTARESWALNHMGDRTSLDMFGEQDELVEAIAGTGKPIAALLFNGRPLSVGKLAERVPALLECWYAGQESGTAVADVLFGKFNPGGKLPISIPRSVGHIPAYYNHKPSDRRGFLFDDASPLFPFGFGLSYTRFELGTPRLEKAEIKPDESTRVLVEVKNAGKREGSEVVQLYIRDNISSVTRPVKELKGFKKIELKPGESQTVALEISPESLSFYDIDMRFTVEPGTFDIMVGTSSDSKDLQTIPLQVTAP